MRLEIIPNFIVREEADVLNAFVLDGVSSGVFKRGGVSNNPQYPDAHMVTRFNPDIVFPDVALNILERLKVCLNMTDADLYTEFHPTSITVNCSFNQGRVVKHKDGVNTGLSLLRCNILSSAPESGGVLHVNDKPFIQSELSVYLCLVSEYYHYVTPVEGNKPRILWQYGFNVRKEDWENNRTKVHGN